MNTPLIITTISSGTFSYDDGFAIYRVIEPYLEQQKEVEVSFSGTGGLPSSFLHGFLGEAFDRYGVERVKQFIKMTNLSGVQADTLRTYALKYQELKKSA